jgi:CBS domain-containing protein
MRRSEFMTEKREFHSLTAMMLMEQEIKSCRPTDSARYVASQITKLGIGSLPVVDSKGMLVGLVSEFDVLDILLKDQDLKDVPVDRIMTKDLKVVNEETPVDDIIRMLETHHLIRVPVVKDGKLVGVVSRRDVLFGYIKSTAEYWP